MRHKINKALLKCPERKAGSTQTNVVTEIRQYHETIVSADKSIADIGKAQIRAAYKCGQLLDRERANVGSGQWGRFCDKCGISEDTAGRYIKLSKSADLRDLIEKYRTLNSAYQGEGITSPQRQRITVTTPPDSAVKPNVAHRSNQGGGTNGGGKVDLARSNGDGHNGIDLKAKVKGGGNLGDLLNRVSPKARADIQSQLQNTANGEEAEKATFRTPAPEAYVRYGPNHDGDSTTDERKIDPSQIGGEEIARLFERARLIDALLLQLNRSAECNDAAELAACALSIEPVIEWYEKYAAKAEALAE